MDRSAPLRCAAPTALRALLLLAPVLVTPLAAAPATPQEAAIEREHRVRTWARDPAGHLGLLSAALASEDWQEREAAFDALARCPGTLPASLAGAFERLDEEPHHNVRAAGLRALAAHPERGAGLDPARLDALAADPSPLVRRASIGCLHARSEIESAAVPDAVGGLRRLADDPEPRIRREARRVLAVVGAPATQALAEVLTEGGALDTAALLDLLPFLVRAPRRGALSTQLRARLGGTPGEEAEAWLLGLALEEQRAGLDVECERARLAELWFTGGVLEARPPRSERLRLARLGDAALGRALVARLASVEEPAARSLMVQAIAEALPPSEASRALEALSDGLAETGWRTLGDRTHRWTAAELEPWTSPDRGAGLRMRAASLAAESLEVGADAELEALLIALVNDDDPGLRIAAFHWAARVPHLGDFAAGLHAAWRELEPEAGLERLRELPRKPALTPFRDDLVALLESGRRDASLFELLGAFEGDPVAFAAVERALGGILLELQDQDGPAPYRTVEGHARQAVGALVRLDADAAVAPLVAALAAQEAVPPPENEFGTRRWRLSKASLGGLVRSAAGRAEADLRLADPSAPRRVRIEAALLRADDVPAARRYLRDEFDDLDGQLAERAVRAWEHGDEPWIDARLEELARAEMDEALPGELATLAVEVLGARRQVAVLGALLAERELPYDLFWALLTQVGEVGDPSHAAPLEALFASELERGRLERAVEVLVARSRLGPLPGPLVPLALAAPRAAARADLAARFLGQRAADVPARWRSELRLLTSLADGRQLGAVLAQQGAWWTLDARLLAAASRAASPTPSAADLNEAARVGLAGERGAPDREAVRTTLELAVPRRADGDLDLERWLPTLDRLARRARLMSERDLSRHLELHEPREGADPWARLEALRHLVRARLSLEEGDVDGAARHHARAAAPAQRSRRAGEEFDAVGELIAAAR